MQFSIALKANSKIPLQMCSPLLSHPASSVVSFPSLVKIRDAIKIDSNVKLKSE